MESSVQQSSGDQRKTVVFRCDANGRIGSGHLMRCLTLARGLQKRGVPSLFLMRRESLPAFQALYDVLFPEESQGRVPVGFVCLEEGLCEKGRDGTREEEVQSVIRLCRNYQCALLVWDSYDVSEELLSELHAALSLMVVDDTAPLASYDCDLLLNQNVYAPSLRYQVPEGVHLLLGPSYFLLREEFAPCRTAGRCAASNEPASTDVSNILLTMGGADPVDATGQMVELLQGLKETYTLTVVVGGQYRRMTELRRKAERSRHAIRLLQSVQNMAALMAEHDFSLHSGGLTAYELAFLGVPGVTVTVAENQRMACEAFAEQEVFAALGELTSLRKDVALGTLERLLGERDLRHAMSQNGQRLLDGRGVERVVEALLRFME